MSQNGQDLREGYSERAVQEVLKWYKPEVFLKEACHRLALREGQKENNCVKEE